MAIRIPDAPNIVGADTELRSPSMVNPVQERFQGKVDFSGLQEDIGDVTRYYQGMVRDQTNTYLTDGKNEYFQHMTSYQNKVFQDHQGKNAVDLYAQYIKPESNKWLKEKFGDPKDDGEVRIVDEELKNQFSSWVDSQQPHFITSTANYEEREWDKFRQTAFEARDNTAANLILNATSPVTIQNGINAFRENTYTANPGMDKDFIEQAIASKVDASLVGHLNQVALTKPMRAFRELNTYQPITDNITEKSKLEVMETIRKSYKNIGIDEAAHYEANDGGSIGMIENDEALALIFGPDKVAEVKAEMRSKSSERAAALRKLQQGQKEHATNMAVDKVRSARTDMEFADAMKDWFAVDEESANSFVAARDSWLANQQDVRTAGIGMNERIGKIAERAKEFAPETYDEKTQERINIASGVVKGIAGTFGVSPRFLDDKIEETTGAAFQEYATKEVKELKDSDVNAIVEDMVAEEGELNRPRIEAAMRLYKTSLKRQNQMPRYKELATRISNGEIRAYDSSLMGDLDYPVQEQLMDLIHNNNQYLDTKKDLKNAGIDLDKVITDNGIDAQYNKLDIASQNLLKRNIVYEINAAKARNQGAMPDEETINGIALRVQKNSVSPIMGLLQDTALAENMSAENLTPAQRLELGVRESVKWEYNKPDKKTLSNQIQRAESTIDRLSNSDRLNEDEQQYIKQNKAYLVTLLQAGDLAGIVNFIGLATQGGF